ncbi:MAG TPA: phage/plasmid primase, P4 family [Methylocella sp.]|nr:phage/plasmid primase, P4 family [Methylocella sp.]
MSGRNERDISAEREAARAWLDFNEIESQPVNYDLDEIIRRLRDSAPIWVPQHFPNGRREGDEWRLANIKGDTPRKNGSCVIALKGQRAGDWYDHDTGQGGDPLSALEEKTLLTGRDLFAYAAALAGWSHASSSRSASPQPRAKKTKRCSPEDTFREMDFILKAACAIRGTHAAEYLAARGLSSPRSDDLLFHPDLTHWQARSGFPGMVAIVRDVQGERIGLHRTFLDPEKPAKAGVSPARKTLGSVGGGCVRLAEPRDGLLGIAEGIETALAVMTACPDIPVWATISATGMKNAALPPDIARVVILADHDNAGLKAAEEAAMKLACEGRKVFVAAPPNKGDDFNDVLLREGADAVKAAADAAREWGAPELPTKKAPLVTSPDADHSNVVRLYARLSIGSDVEIAERVRRDLERAHGTIVYAEGGFWRYEGTHWQPIPEHELRRAVHAYDGAQFRSPSGEPSCVKLSKNRIDSALHEMAALLAAPDFFAAAPAGINCKSGFIRAVENGSLALEPHSPEHRARHTLPGCWRPGAEAAPPENSLLCRLLAGVFSGDEDAAEKIDLLAEVCGAAALGIATKLRQPRAVILKGDKAQNGKSQILDLARSLLPASAVSSVTAARMGDERHVIGLAGKLLNASDELSSSAAIASGTFKAIITGEPVQGRDVYKSRVEFRPVAQHLFATNSLPVFQGGMDRGVQRRLLVVSFNRIIPVEERVEEIGQRIGLEEPDLLLAWSVAGASRLIRKKTFTLPPSSRSAIRDWLLGADPVLAWLAEEVEIQPAVDGRPRTATRHAYERFHKWAVAEGFAERTLPSINAFVQRITSNATGVEYRRTKQGRFFLGIALKPSDPFDFA